MTIDVYAFEDADGNEDTYTTMDSDAAKLYAWQNSRKLITRTYEFSDSELVEDYTQQQ